MEPRHDDFAGSDLKFPILSSIVFRAVPGHTIYLLENHLMSPPNWVYSASWRCLLDSCLSCILYILKALEGSFCAGFIRRNFSELFLVCGAGGGAWYGREEMENGFKRSIENFMLGRKMIICEWSIFSKSAIVVLNCLP